MPATPNSRSHSQSFNVASRRSLAYPGSPSERKRWFLKDSSHEVSKRTSPEANTHSKLHTDSVPNVSALRLCDRVINIKTETENEFHLLHHSGRCKKFGAIVVCHPITLNNVACDILTFTWCKVLLSCLADAVDDTYENILLYPILNMSNP